MTKQISYLVQLLVKQTEQLQAQSKPSKELDFLKSELDKAQKEISFLVDMLTKNHILFKDTQTKLEGVT